MKFIFPKLHINIERWKWSDIFGIYVSTMGRFKDVNKKELQIKTGDGNYLYIETSKGLRLAHRVVMVTYKPINDSYDYTVDHKDHNPRNNALYNLEWCTEKENKKRGKRDKISDKKKTAAAKDTKHYYCVDLKKSFDTVDDMIEFIHKMAPSSRNIKDKAIISGVDYAVKHKTKAYTYRWKKFV